MSIILHLCNKTFITEKTHVVASVRMRCILKSLVMVRVCSLEVTICMWFSPLEGSNKEDLTPFSLLERHLVGHFTVFTPLAGHPRGHLTMFLPVDGHPRGHFTRLSPLKDYLRGHLIAFSPPEEHPGGPFI